MLPAYLLAVISGKVACRNLTSHFPKDNRRNRTAPLLSCSTVPLAFLRDRPPYMATLAFHQADWLFPLTLGVVETLLNQNFALALRSTDL
jgi:hypothetical protein